MSQAATLDAFARALRREGHNLAQRPDLLWQQVYNRLQWEERLEPVLAHELVSRSAPDPGAVRWLRLRTSLPESEALIRTIPSDSDVNACAISPDGAFVVSANRDNTLKVWEMSVGQERATLQGHAEGVNACAVSPDGAFIVSAGGDGVLAIWDLSDGTVRNAFKAHAPMTEVRDCAISPDGTRAVSAGDGNCDEPRRLLRRGFRPDRDPPLGLGDRRVLPDPGGSAASGGVGGPSPLGQFVRPVSRRLLPRLSGDTYTVKVWDLTTGEERVSLRGEFATPGNPPPCAVSPDGSFVVVGDYFGAIKIWDPTSGREIRTVDLLDLEGIEYGPTIVTPLDRGAGPVLRCPACFREHRLEEAWLGETITCPTPDCGLSVRVNPFVAAPLRPAPQHAEGSDQFDHWYEFEDYGMAGRDMWLCCRRCGHLMEFNPGLGEVLPVRCPACHLEGALD